MGKQHKKQRQWHTTENFDFGKLDQKNRQSTLNTQQQLSEDIYILTNRATSHFPLRIKGAIKSKVTQQKKMEIKLYETF